MNPWNLKAAVYSLFRKVPVIHGIFQKERYHLSCLLNKMDIIPEKCLDVGSGIGSTLDLLPKSNQLVCMDYSFKMAKILKSQNISVQLIQANIIQLPFKKCEFNLISAIGIAEYVKNKLAMLKQLELCLESGGYLLITISPSNIFNWFRNILGNRIYTISQEDWEDIVHQSGLKILNQTESLLQRQYLLKK